MALYLWIKSSGVVAQLDRVRRNGAKRHTHTHAQTYYERKRARIQSERERVKERDVGSTFGLGWGS